MENDKLIFKYRCGNAECAEIGVDDDGFSFEIYESGKIIYKTFIAFNILKKEKNILIDINIVKEINELLEEYNTKISSWLPYTDNGSDDGEFNIFTFKDKKISTLNIDKHDIEKVKKMNPEYYNDYYDIMIQENEVLELFEKVCNILKKCNIVLSLNNVKFGNFLTNTINKFIRKK